MENRVRAALIQYEIVEGRRENGDRVEALLEKAAAGRADLAVLPEMFVQPYDMALIPERAERVPGGPTADMLSRWARQFRMVLAGGSVAEIDDDGRYYNTATIWGPDGELLAKHRKVHLFDVDLPGGVSFRESSILSPGARVTTVRVLGMTMGLAVCYDVRFPELFRLMTLAGADFIALPGAFNNISGPAHWEMLIRNRAVENTVYVAGVSGLSPKDAAYNAWGHSMLADPFGEVVADMGRAEGVAFGDLDPERIKDVRTRLPVLAQRREDLYRLTALD
jgi:predicted amidohydrolase